MPSMNHGRESAQTSAFSTPLWLILVKLPTFHQSQNDASNASFELSAAYYIKFPPRMGEKSLPNAGNIQALASSSAVPGHPQPLYILPSRAKISRGIMQLLSAEAA